MRCGSLRAPHFVGVGASLEPGSDFCTQMGIVRKGEWEIHPNTEMQKLQGGITPKGTNEDVSNANLPKGRYARL